MKKFDTNKCVTFRSEKKMFQSYVCSYQISAHLKSLVQKANAQLSIFMGKITNANNNTVRFIVMKAWVQDNTGHNISMC